MKKIVILITIMILALVISVNNVYAATGKTNAQTTRLREEPNSDSRTLTLIPISEEIEIVAKEGDWYKVKYKDMDGYIFGELLDVTGKVEENQKPEENIPTPEEPEIPEEQTPVPENKNPLEKLPAKMKAKREINVKITPLINSSNIGKIEAEKELTVTEVINDWCYIVAENASGWTKSSNLAEIVTEPVDVKPVEPSQNDNETGDIDVETKIGYVSATSLYVRSEPTIDSEVIKTIYRNQEVEITGKTDGWYAVNIGETKGYVSARYISDTKIETTSRGSNDVREPIASENKVTNTVVEPSQIKNPETMEKIEEQKNGMVEPVKETQGNPKQEETANNLGEQIVEYAKKYLGCKYVSGGTTPKGGFDCSGFTQYVYAHFDIKITRSSKTQAKDGKYVDKEDLQIGDLIIFNNTDNTAVGHTGIYVGGGKFIHAANAKKGVIITSLSDSYYKARYVSSRRVF